jgi:AraC-like DNA-binding protein
MLSRAIETDIPVYTLEQSSLDGSKLFEIVANKNCALTPQQKALFFVPHRKDYYTLVFVREANSRHWVDMVPYTVQPDRLYFNSPQQMLLKEVSGLFDGIAIHFTEEFLGIEENRLLKQLPIIHNPHNGHELILTGADVAFIDDITAKLLAEYHHHLGWRNGMLLAYLRVLLIYISRIYTAQYTDENRLADRELLKKFKGLVTEHFTRIHDVAAYAAMLHLSAGHFSEMIKEQSGKTAIEHIHDRLLLEAKRMLFHSDHSIKEIAFRLGFEDASYFNRFFKRLTSATPMGYRTHIREMYH